jgi:hypothetical protein
MPQRIGFVLLSALAVLLALRKPKVGVPETSSLDLGMRERELSMELANARLHWSAIEQRDAITSSSQVAIITVSGFSPGSQLRGEDSAYVIGLIERASRDSTVLIRAHFYNPSAYARNWWGAYTGALISRDERTTCTAIIPMDAYPNGNLKIGRNGLISSLAPCLFLGAFGSPGRTVGNWLEALRYAPARSGKWLMSSAVEVWDSDPWAWLRDFGTADPAGAQGFSLSKFLGLEREAQLLTPPYYFGQIGVQCLSGMKFSCAKAVVDSGIISEKTGELPRDLTVAPSLIRASNITALTPRPPGATFLSDLIRDKGPERFKRFWKSERPFERAFEDAFEESLADWTSRWAKEKWLKSWDSRYRSEDVLLGVTLQGSWIPLALAWSLLALGVAGWAARHRQVTS